MATETIGLREAIQRLSGFLQDREQARWDNVVVLPFEEFEAVDKSVHDSESARLRDEMIPYRLRPNFIPALCQVFCCVLGQAGHQTSPDMAKSYLQTGINFLWAYAQQARSLGHFEKVCEVFDQVQWSISEYNPKPTAVATMGAMSMFVGNNLEQMHPHHVARFFAHGAEYTDCYREYPSDLKIFLFFHADEFRRSVKLRMNQGLAMFYIASVGGGTIKIEPRNLMPGAVMASKLIDFCQLCIRHQETVVFSKLVHVDILLIAQTINVVSHMFKNSDSAEDKAVMEQGIEALLRMTLAPMEKAPTAARTMFKEYGIRQSSNCSDEAYEALMRRLLSCLKTTPATRSKSLDACQLRLKRLIINDMAFSGTRLAYFRDFGGSWIDRFLKVTKAGYVCEEDFKLMGESARLFFVRNVADCPARQALQKNDFQARVAGFHQDLGL